MSTLPHILTIQPSGFSPAARPGRPKGVIQSHASFANSTECYAKGILGYRADDITLSVPKL